MQNCSVADALVGFVSSMTDCVDLTAEVLYMGH
jgi:hypothetical protein